MFKGSGQINPQGLKNDYSGFERAAAIKQQTMAGIGKAIKEGHEKIVKKKKDAAAVESGRVLMEQVAKSAGFEIDQETLAAIAKGADPEFMKDATNTMTELGKWEREQIALKEKQDQDREIRQQLANLVESQQNIDVSEGGLDRGSRENINAAGITSREGIANAGLLNASMENRLERVFRRGEGDKNRAATKTAADKTNEITMRGQDMDLGARMAANGVTIRNANLSADLTREGHDLQRELQTGRISAAQYAADHKLLEIEKMLDLAGYERDSPEHTNAMRAMVELTVNGKGGDDVAMYQWLNNQEVTSGQGTFSLPRVNSQNGGPGPGGGQGGQGGPTRTRSFNPLGGKPQPAIPEG